MVNCTDVLVGDPLGMLDITRVCVCVWGGGGGGGGVHSW